MQYDYVDILDIFKKEEKIATASLKADTEPSDKKTVGKPPLDEEDVEDDNTAASKEQGGNVSDNKE